MTVWHRVVWARHTFIAAVIFLVSAVLLLSVRNPDAARETTMALDRSDEVVILGSAAIALIYWVPCALGAYAHLRLMRRVKAASGPMS